MSKTFLTLCGFALLLVSGLFSVQHAHALSPIFSQTPFTCGPNLETYVVRGLDGREGMGIRCVKRSNGSAASTKVPAFAWYGEGSWYGSTCRYRHVGQAYLEKKDVKVLKGFASDMTGNGECADANYPGNLKIKIIDADHIQVKGAGWDEEWTRTTGVDYVPLAAPTSCGKWFDQYRAISVDTYTTKSTAKNADPTNSGLRCVMKAGPRNTTWYGVGSWEGKSYAHLATGSSKGYGSSDFCRPSDSFCADFAYGKIKRHISSKTKLPVIDGWNEVWLKIKP